MCLAPELGIPTLSKCDSRYKTPLNLKIIRIYMSVNAWLEEDSNFPECLQTKISEQNYAHELS